MQKTYKLIVLFCTLIFISSGVSAYTCRSKVDGKVFPNGVSSYDVKVPLNRELRPGKTIFFDMSKYFECKNDVPSTYVDIMNTYASGITTRLDGGAFDLGAYVNDVKYNLPASGVNVFRLTDGSWHDLPIVVFYSMKDFPGHEVKVSAGEKIASVELYKYSIPAGSENYFTWNIIAGNDSIFTSGTCDVNDGKDIQIDFGQLNYQKLSSSGETGIYRRDVYVPYRCKNPVSMPIQVTLSADSSIFSQESIRLSNKNIGVKMYYDNKLIKPGDSIHTELQNGLGGSQLVFALVKKNGADVNTGPFTGSAVLVMSAD